MITIKKIISFDLAFFIFTFPKVLQRWMMKIHRNTKRGWLNMSIMLIVDYESRRRRNDILALMTHIPLIYLRLDKIVRMTCICTFLPFYLSLSNIIFLDNHLMHFFISSVKLSIPSFPWAALLQHWVVHQSSVVFQTL